MQAPSKREVEIAVGFSAAILFGIVLVNALALSRLVHDFTGIYVAARMVAQGEGARLYDLPTQAQAQQALFHWKGVLTFLHPPFEAWMFAPLGLLPYTAAYVIWGTINIALWVFFMYLLRPYAPVPRNPLQYLMLCFFFFPVWVALMQGQTSILLLAVLSLAFVCMKRGRDGWAGVFVGLGLLKFSLAAPLALIFLLKGKWRLVAGFAGAAFMLGVVSFLAAGRAGMTGYANLLVDTMRHPNYYSPYGISVAAMPTLRGLFHSVLAPLLPASAINGMVVLVSGFLIGYVVWRWRGQGLGAGQGFDLMFAAALVIAQVTSHHLLIHDLSPTLIAVLLILGSARYAERSLWRPTRTAVIAALYVIPLCLPKYLLAPVLVLLAGVAMAGAASLEAVEPRLVPERQKV